MLSSSISVEFHHIGRSPNGFADLLAKQAVDMSLPFSSHVLSFLMKVTVERERERESN